jgi:iron complex transport system substrate-binding protein
MWSWYIPSSDSPLVHLWLAKIAYPKTFADVDLKQTTKDYYHNFYKYDLTDAQLEQIINPQRN